MALSSDCRQRKQKHAAATNFCVNKMATFWRMLFCRFGRRGDGTSRKQKASNLLAQWEKHFIIISHRRRVRSLRSQMNASILQNTKDCFVHIFLLLVDFVLLKSTKTLEMLNLQMQSHKMEPPPSNKHKHITDEGKRWTNNRARIRRLEACFETVAL